MDSISGPWYFDFDSHEFPGKVMVRSVTFETKIYTQEEFLERNFRILDTKLPSVKVLLGLLKGKKNAA